jgi:glycosyltransferase involved in cell wall biosynthesis
MRIAVVVPGGVDRSGEYRVIPALLALLTRLARRHDVHVFSLLQGSEPGEWPLAGALVHNTGLRLTRTRTIAAILGMHRSVRFDLIQAIWSGSPGLVAMTAARLLRIPGAIHLAGGELVALPDIAYGGLLRRRGQLRERLMLHLAAAVSAPSAPVIAAAAKFGIQAERSPLGVDLGSWPPRPPVAREPGARARLVHVASLNRVKDQPTLLRALQRVAQAGIDFHLDIVGEDVLGGEIQRLVHQLGLAARVAFHGFLPQQRVRPILDAAHLMVMSSRHEAGPLVLLEAAVAGVPSVGTAVGHLREWAPEAARAVPVGDSAALAAAIIQLISDEALRLGIAQEAFRRGVAEDAEHTAQRFEALYERLARASQTRAGPRRAA